MSTTFIDLPGPLYNTNEPIDFTTDRLVSSISIEFNPHLGNGARETVWDGTSDADDTGGDFSFRYRGSHHSDLTSDGPYTWTIKRDTRWPAEFRIRIKETRPVSNGPDLQDLIHSPVGAWALDNTAAGGYVVDRSGNGYTLNVPPMGVGSDLRVGHSSVFGNLMGLADSGGDSAFRFGGSAFTCIIRYASRGAAEEFLVGHTAGTSGFVNSWELRVTAAGRVKYASGSNNENQVLTEELCPVGPWGVVSIRRNAARTQVVLGYNDTFETKTVVATTAITGALRFGGQQVAPFVAGGIADCVIWPVELTDAEVLAQYRKMMGV